MEQVGLPITCVQVVFVLHSFDYKLELPTCRRVEETNMSSFYVQWSNLLLVEWSPWDVQINMDYWRSSLIQLPTVNNRTMMSVLKLSLSTGQYMPGGWMEGKYPPEHNQLSDLRSLFEISFRINKKRLKSKTAKIEINQTPQVNMLTDKIQVCLCLTKHFRCTCIRSKVQWPASSKFGTPFLWRSWKQY